MESHTLAQIIGLKAILLPEEFEGNIMFKSQDICITLYICLGTTENHRFGVCLK